MANTIITKNSATATAVPTAGQLVQGELAVNVTDKRLFTENSGGTVVELGVNPSSLTLTSGTANGVTYLNGSKVLTSGSALTFDGSTFTTTAGIEGTKLTTAGNISLYNSSSSQLTHYQQLSSSYTASYIQSALSGASSSLVFAVNSNWTNGNASEQMRLTSTGLGIGTSSPVRTLSIANGGPVVEIDPAGGTAGPIYFNYNRSTAAYLTPEYWALAHIWNVSGGTKAMTLDSSGNLGLGATPSAFATVKAMQLNTASTLMAFTNEFDIGQNVYYNAGNKYITTGAATLYAQTTGQHQWFNAPSGTAGNAISFTQAMTLDASGNLLVGTTSLYGGEKLALVQSTNNRGFVIQQTNASNTSPPFLIDCSRIQQMKHITHLLIIILALAHIVFM
jgi:hypothetical protein